MEHDYWHKQEPGKPLFPDLLWSRPENRMQAGKLLIIGGNLHGFSAPAEAYQASQKAGIGVARVVMPDKVKSIAGRLLETVDYAPSTAVGSFGREALAELLDHSVWADGVLLAGDLGRNSETAIVLEAFVSKYSGPLIITKDAADYFTATPQPILDRPQTTLVLSLAQLQKLAITAHFTRPITFDMDLLRLTGMLHEFTEKYALEIITKHLETIFVAVNGQVSTTKLTTDKEVWRVQTAAQAAVWRLQNPLEPFKALTTSVN